MLAAGYAPWALRNLITGGSFLSPQYEAYYAGGTQALSPQDQLLVLITRAAGNLWAYVTSTVPAVVSGAFDGLVARLFDRLGLSWLLALLGGLIMVVIVIGAIARLRRHGVDPALVFLLFYIPVLLAYTFVDARFLWPVLPVLYVYLFAGLVTVAAWLHSRRLLRLAIAAILIVMVARRPLTGGQGHADVLQSRTPGANWVAWLQSHTEPDAVLMTGLPTVLSFVTDRYTSNYVQQPCTLQHFVSLQSQATPVYLVLYPVAGLFRTPPTASRRSSRLTVASSRKSTVAPLLRSPSSK